MLTLLFENGTPPEEVDAFASAEFERLFADERVVAGDFEVVEQ